MNFLERVEDAMTLDSPLMRASRSLLHRYKKQATDLRQALINDDSTLVPATVASRADALYIWLFYKMVVASMFDRAILLQHNQPLRNT